MRDPKRISKMLKKIEKLWKMNPDLRLGQLICNCYRACDLYYIEDVDFIEGLELFYEHREEV